MMYYEYHFLGMHLIWWAIWALLMTWIFVSPYSIPFQERKMDRPLQILKKNFVKGKISEDVYYARKKIIESRKNIF